MPRAPRSSVSQLFRHADEGKAGRVPGTQADSGTAGIGETWHQLGEPTFRIAATPHCCLVLAKNSLHFSSGFAEMPQVFLPIGIRRHRLSRRAAFSTVTCARAAFRWQAPGRRLAWSAGRSAAMPKRRSGLLVRATNPRRRRVGAVTRTTVFRPVSCAASKLSVVLFTSVSSPPW